MGRSHDARLEVQVGAAVAGAQRVNCSPCAGVCGGTLIGMHHITLDQGLTADVRGPIAGSILLEDRDVSWPYWAACTQP